MYCLILFTYHFEMTEFKNGEHINSCQGLGMGVKGGRGGCGYKRVIVVRDMFTILMWRWKYELHRTKYPHTQMSPSKTGEIWRLGGLYECGITLQFFKERNWVRCIRNFSGLFLNNYVWINSLKRNFNLKSHHIHLVSDFSNKTPFDLYYYQNV